jgi:hypothetical protein
MPEAQTIADWMTRIVDWPHSIAQLLGPVPVWVLVPLLFLPSLAAVATRSWLHLIPVVMLNALIAHAALAWPPGELRLLGIGVATALILAVLGDGFRRRGREHAMAEVQARLAEMERRVAAFLEALDQRARLVEERAIELAETRLRNRPAEAGKDPAAKGQGAT